MLDGGTVATLQLEPSAGGSNLHINFLH